MSRYDSDFPEPPWTYAPKEVEAWLTSVAQGAKVSKLDAYKNEADRTLENVEILLDVDAARTRVKPSTAFMRWLQDLTGRVAFEAHFEVPAVAELVGRALASGQYHGITRIVVDGEVAFNQSERPKDLRGMIGLLAEASHRATRCETVEFRVIDDEVGDTTAVVTVRRLLKKGDHAIGVRFEGAVSEENFRKFLSYLTKNLNATFVYNGVVPQA